MIQDMLPPRLWDRSGRCAAHLGERRPVVYALEVADRGLDVFAARGGVGLDAVGDFEEQFPGTPPLSPPLVVGLALCGLGRSEERRVGTECVSPCRSRMSQYL